MVHAQRPVLGRDAARAVDQPVPVVVQLQTWQIAQYIVMRGSDGWIKSMVATCAVAVELGISLTRS